jgi:endonuclease/exonuclease/phosphatase family metal-dependent hydrolase
MVALHKQSDLSDRKEVKMKTKILSSILLLIFALTLSLTYFGCGGGKKGTPITTPPPQEETINYDQIPVVSTNGEATIGTSGGKITLENASIAVPENAVTESTNFSIEKITPQDIINTPPQTLIQAGNYYIVSSTTTEFQKPVQIAIPYDETVSQTNDDLALTDIYIWNGEEYIALPTDVDTTNKTLKAYIENLSEDINIAKSKKKNLVNITTSGIYVFKKDKDKISSKCQSSGGKFNGYYCECAPGTYWNYNSSECVQSEYQGKGKFYEGNEDYRILTANVGNSNPLSWKYNYKLCDIEVEARVANSIRKYNPDIVAIQERLPYSWCRNNPSLANNIKKVCALEGEQIERLLGNDYSIVCTSLSDGNTTYRYASGISADGYECIGIKNNILSNMVFDRDSDLIDSCSSDTGALRVEVNLKSGKQVTIINAHTATPFNYSVIPPTLDLHANASCRASQFTRIFNAQGNKTLIMGDMNMDPHSGLYQDSADVKSWNDNMTKYNYYYHSDYNTKTTRWGVFDHVISNFALPVGGCRPLQDTANLDKGEGMDHNAILCDSLNFSGSPQPKGDISGTIRDATNGKGVPNISIKFRRGENIKEGTIIATTTTDSDGNYIVYDLDEGTYTGEMSGEGYVTDWFPVKCIGGQTNYNQDGNITPILPAGQTRIILTWGETPEDLDAHLTGPLPNGDRFHLYFIHADTCDHWNCGDNPWPEYVNLDIDDTTSWGPETTTIYQQISGVYRFSVHNYTNRYEDYSYSLSNSGAVVKIYRGTGRGCKLVSTFKVPANKEGTLWTVFEMNGNNITAINTMSYESDSDSVARQKRISKTDAELLINLPAKIKKANKRR